MKKREWRTEGRGKEDERKRHWRLGGGAQRWRVSTGWDGMGPRKLQWRVGVTQESSAALLTAAASSVASRVVSRAASRAARWLCCSVESNCQAGRQGDREGGGWKVRRMRWRRKRRVGGWLQ